LRALQICDIPQFRAGQDCKEPKILGSGTIFEATPECVKRNKRLWHPDAIIGECLDQIGNVTLHPPARREWSINNITNSNNFHLNTTFHGWRIEGYGGDSKYDKYHKENAGAQSTMQYPLWSANDFRSQAGGKMHTKADGSTTAYHFHNFFPDSNAIHNKYFTFGHAMADAMEKPIWEICNDLSLAVDCAHENFTGAMSFADMGGSVKPIYYMDKDTRKEQHTVWQDIVKGEENSWNNNDPNSMRKQSKNISSK
jgi:hypothetical protein